LNLNRSQWANVRRSLQSGRKPTASEMIEALQDLDELFADLEAANTCAIHRGDMIRDLLAESRQ
jgi:hypothetical protein